MRLQGRALEYVAAAYALGTLDPRARRRFEELLARDIPARRAWQQWEEKLSVLAVDIPPVRPADSAWQQIERRLQPKAPRSAGSQLRWLIATVLVVGIAVAMVWKKIRQ